MQYDALLQRSDWENDRPNVEHPDEVEHPERVPTSAANSLAVSFEINESKQHGGRCPELEITFAAASGHRRMLSRQQPSSGPTLASG